MLEMNRACMETMFLASLRILQPSMVQELNPSVRTVARIRWVQFLAKIDH